MNGLDEDVRRLIVEAGLVAVNHGLLAQAHAIRAAHGDLVDDPDLRKLLDAAMLIGLGARTSAERLLVGDASPEAQVLRRLTEPNTRQRRPH